MDFGAIPARTLRREHGPEIVIGTDTDPRHEELERYLPEAVREFLAAGHAEVEASRAACDVVIEL